VPRDGSFSACFNAWPRYIVECSLTIRIGEPSGDRTQDPLIKSDPGSRCTERSENESTGTSVQPRESDTPTQGGEPR
jgi:hypothetical protein